MVAANRVQDKDRGYKKLLRRVKKSGGRVVAVGVVEGPQGAGTPVSADAQKEGALDLTVAAVASVHEFGLGNVPERSFIRGWFDANESKIRTLQRKVARQVLKGKLTEEQGLQLLGVTFQGQIQQRIAEGIGDPLSEETIARKGSTKQLIDKGQLRQSISWKVIAA